MKKQEDIYILAIESSCDDTSIACLKNNQVICMNTYTQNEHNATQGVVPEIAARLHANKIFELIETSLKEADWQISDISTITCTKEPGLMPSLLVGQTVAQSMSHIHDIPITWVNHIEGHVFSLFLDREEEEVRFPMVVLSASGGHNDLYIWNHIDDLIRLGYTKDDSAGESMDKIGRELGLPFPAGKYIDQLSQQYQEESSDFLACSFRKIEADEEKKWADTLSELSPELGNKEHIKLGLFLGEEMIGSQAIQIDKNTAQILYSAIKEEYRGRGYGRYMFLSLESYLKGKNCRKIQSNPKEETITFYEKLGYVFSNGLYTKNISYLYPTQKNIISGVRHGWFTTDIEKDSYLFSFSGLKSSAIRLIQDAKKYRYLSDWFKKKICYEYQEAIVTILERKIQKVSDDYATKNIGLVGGVSANSRLREKITESGLDFITPKRMSYCTDNAAMIGMRGYYLFKEKKGQSSK